MSFLFKKKNGMWPHDKHVVGKQRVRSQATAHISGQPMNGVLLGGIQKEWGGTLGGGPQKSTNEEQKEKKKREGREGEEDVRPGSEEKGAGRRPRFQVLLCRSLSETAVVREPGRLLVLRNGGAKEMRAVTWEGRQGRTG